jgi:RNA polymerase sigma factor
MNYLCYDSDELRAIRIILYVGSEWVPVFFSSINSRVERMKKDPEDMNLFIEEYKPFIASCVGKSIGRFVEYGKDDELSIGLLAFVEAIHCFDKAKGSFLSFAQLIIKKRIIDYYRKEKKYTNVVSLYAHSPDYETDEIDLTDQKSIESYATENINENRRLELIQFKEELKRWDIAFEELIEASPKHDKLREIYKEVIYHVLCNRDLANIVLQKKYLPIAEIEKNIKVPRKKIERGRRYIISAIIVLTGDYQYIREFLNWMWKMRLP